LLGHLGINKAGGNGISRDAVRGNLLGNSPGRANDAGFVAEALLACPWMPAILAVLSTPMLFNHMPQHSSGAEEDTL